MLRTLMVVRQNFFIHCYDTKIVEQVIKKQKIDMHIRKENSLTHKFVNKQHTFVTKT
jgi:uncharacterized protein (UPF0335 family)